MFQIRPDIVSHAAAHKHLPLLERYPSEGVKTNVLGTANVVAAAVAAGVACLVNVSTDKAARPTSVLGATKRLAELVVSAHAGRGTRVASVRFGNVLGSRGSFLHSLAYQVENARPVTITHPDVTRFFMTIPEAAGLVIESASMADRGETYVLDMGAPVRIVDLVRRFVQLTGHRAPNVRYTGLRPGEKMHEELLDDAESRMPTAHSRIWAMRAKYRTPSDLLAQVDALYPLTVSGQVEALMRNVDAMLPKETVVSLSPVPSVMRRAEIDLRTTHSSAGDLVDALATVSSGVA
jgi:FlaA1/EpsC-like NDP-sugar epimerase